VPIDDNHTRVSPSCTVDRPFRPEEIKVVYSVAAVHARMARSGCLPPAGWYLIERICPRLTRAILRWTVSASAGELQRLWGVHSQDRALAENSELIGGRFTAIIDRSLSHL